MGIIDELARKLKAAKKEQARLDRNQQAARQAWASAETAYLKASDRVDELERAISLLRNGLKTPATQSGNVTPLKKS